MKSDNAPDAAPPPTPDVRPPIAAGTMAFTPDTSVDGRPPADREPGRVRVGEPLGKYQITAVLGQGGMGTVLKAHDPAIERDVAIKVLADYLAADPTSAWPVSRRGQGGRQAQPPQRRRASTKSARRDRRITSCWNSSPAAASPTASPAISRCRCWRRRRR